MGRLYWKFFIFFFLAQLTTVIGVGVSISIQHEHDEQQRERISQLNPQAKSLALQHRPPPPRHKHFFPVMPIFIGMLASLIFAALLAWYFSKPIKQLRQAFASAANGNLDVRVGNAMGSRRDELADLGSAFDVMATRLGALMQSQTRLLHQVSHELRSPLARLQIAVGLARQQPDNLESSLVRIERESERMDNLVGELLELSRLESGVMRIEKESIDLNELLMTIVEDARFEGMAKQIVVDYEPTGEIAVPVTLLAQQDLLHRAIDNVVRNALKYSPNQARISIATLLDNSGIKVTVTDHGPGVADGELETIFQAFFRGSNANNADGHGVGLAIAKQIIEAHGGTVTASNHQAGGLTVEIRLPKA
jgi:two-component system OmpR family sensor kinase